MKNIVYKPIGTIHSPFNDVNGAPIQPASAQGVEGSVEVFAEHADGLKDLDGFSHIILIYHFHRSVGYQLQVIPFLDNLIRGVFATRAPKRPNAIGLSVVKLTKIKGNTLYIEGVDVLEGTPLLDIKPYIPEFDSATNVTIGWVEGKRETISSTKADNRFG